MADSQSVPEPVRELAAKLAEPTPMRRGSLSERFVKCSKPGCGCGEKAENRHGPYYSLTRVVEGKTHSRFCTREQAELIKQQVEAGKQFRSDVDAFWEACEEWADAQIDGIPATPHEGGEKKGSTKRSQRRLPKKSKD